MKKNAAVIFILLFVVLFSLFFYPPVPSQAGWQDALTRENLSKEEYRRILTYYYQNPQPAKLFSVLKVCLSDNDLLSDQMRLNPIIHLFATAAHRNKTFLNNLMTLRNSYSGLERQVLDDIINSANRFQSPAPNSPIALDYLWAEFVITGEETPVKKIISVLDYRYKKIDDRKFTDGDVNQVLVYGAARWSLAANAKQNRRVYDIIQREFASAQGNRKQNLEEILKIANTP